MTRPMLSACGRLWAIISKSDEEIWQGSIRSALTSNGGWCCQWQNFQCGEDQIETLREFFRDRLSRAEAEFCGYYDAGADSIFACLGDLSSCRALRIAEQIGQNFGIQSIHERPTHSLT